MRCYLRLFPVGLLAVLLNAAPSWGVDLLTPGDPAVAFDLDPPASASSSPANESPAKAIDGTLAKYLNFGEDNSGVIVDPVGFNNNFGISIVQSLRLTTANDAEVRDPASYQVFGTFDSIVSTNNSAGVGESWTLISSGALACPAARNTPCPVVSFPNVEPYLYYKVLFPTVKNAASANSMQVAEIQLYESTDGSGVGVFTPGDPILGVDISPSSSSPGGEQVPLAIDGNPGTKYLNFGAVNSGLIVTPSIGPETIVTSFVIRTANDAVERDPSAWSLYGTNDPVTSPQHSNGTNEDWTLIASGLVDLPLERGALGPVVDVPNDTAYSSYRMVFTGLRNAGAANSMQIAEIQFQGRQVPEPSTCILSALGLLTLVAIRGRRRA